MTMPEVRITRKGADRLLSGHPWVFVSDVSNAGKATAGEAVRVLDPSGRPLGVAHYSSKSQIALRLLSEKTVDVDKAFFASRIQAAFDYRQQVVRDSNAYRLIFGEADQMPGLVVDRYNDALVVQALNQGMDSAMPVILECLDELCSPRVVILRNDASVRTKEGLALETRVVKGLVDAPVAFGMNGMTLSADLIGGQKTGVFLDQRENYLAAARWARGKALDCFTSTGGFALHMAAGCDSVEAVDSSEPALAIAARNAHDNGIGNVAWKETDVFQLLSGHRTAGRRFDTIVLDPPAFAKSRGGLDAALRGYKEINLKALRMLEPGGRLITCSCSHHVPESELLQVLAEAALDAHRTLRVLERRTQSMDHPILLTVPETHYLKCLIVMAM